MRTHRTWFLTLFVLLSTGIAFAADTQGPVVSQVAANPTIIAAGSGVTVLATISDSNTGASNIAGADYSIGGGPWISMSAADGQYDTASENVLSWGGPFLTAGVYSLCVRGRDSAGNVGVPDCGTLIPVYDPQAGFVTGGGWIMSPAGAYIPNPALTGKATFGFVSKYVNGAQTPSGNTQFQFHAAGFDFQSVAYEWLVVAGEKAQYKGSGTVNGSAGYSFLLTATDGQLLGSGGIDKFRIKVWSSVGVIYDNVRGSSDDLNNANPQVIDGGSIVVHRSNSSNAPDLALTKLGSASPIMAGTVLTYTLGVANQGTAGVTNVLLTDTLPAGTSLVSASSICTYQSLTVNCSLGNMAAGASTSVTVMVTVNATSGNITNTANVSGTEAESTTSNNTASVTTAIVAPDLILTKADSPDPVGSGATLTYTLTGTNQGLAPANQVTVTDPLPSSLTFVSASPGCAYSSGTVTCNLGTLAPGASAAITITAGVTATAGTISNTATIASSNPESNTANNTATAITAVGFPDLKVVKDGSPNPVISGNRLTYAVTVSNIGQTPAANVVVTDPLPSGVAFVSASAGCAVSGGTVTCSLGSVPPGGATSVNITVTVTATSGDVINTVTVATSSPEPNTSNNSASTRTTVIVPILADVSLSKQSTPNPVAANAAFDYQLTVTNLGTAIADNVQVTDTLPAGVTYLSASPGCAQSAGTVTCSLGTLNVGAVAAVTIHARAPLTPTQLTNTANATTTSPESSTANNTATENTSVIAAPDLVVTNTDSPDPVGRDANLTYTVTVKNEGITVADNVVLVDSIPSNQVFQFSPVSGTASQGTCTPSTTAPIITCNVGSLPPSTSATFTAVVRINVPTGSLTNTATASTTTFEPNTTNNSATSTTTIGGPDVTIAKTAPELVLPGSPLTYTLFVSNGGTADAANVVVTDNLPSGVNFVSATAPCTQASGVVTCNLGTMASGSNVELSIQTTLTATSGTVTNSAAVTATIDTNPSNNQSQATTTVAVPDLSVLKIGTPNPVAAGAVLTYTINVSNDGASAAQNVTVTDPLPAGVTFLSASPGCSAVSGVVTCNIGTLDAGKGVTTAQVQIRATVSATSGSITNTVQVSTSTPETNTANNTATATTTIGTPDLSLTKAAAPNPVATGGSLTYALTVTNNGTAQADDVVLQDDLKGVTFVSNLSKALCSQSGTLLTCQLGSLGPGAITEVDLLTTVTAGAGTLTNTATITTSTIEPNRANNTATVNTTVYIPGQGTADVSLTKTSSPNPVAGNAVFDYQLQVSNPGTAIAENVQVTDTLPAGVTFLAASPGCTQSAGTVTCVFGTLSIGAVATASIHVRAPLTPTQLTNTANVTTTSPESSTANNTATDIMSVITAPDLVITNTDSPDPVAKDANLTYTITVKNEGIAAADNVVLVDAIPSNQLFQFGPPLTFNITQGTCTPSTTSPTITCSIGSLPAGASVTFTAAVRINVSNGALTNTATVSTTTFEPNPNNNTAVAETAIGGADITIFKSAPGTALVNSLLTYTLSVRNQGTANAVDVVVSDTLPAGLQFVSATAPCSQALGVVTCNLGTVAPSGGVDLSIQATVIAPSGTITNTATVSTSSPDTNTNNNTSSASTTVVLLYITNTASPDPVLPNGTLTYTLTLTNIGTATVSDVTIVDNLPGSVHILSTTGNCTQDKDFACSVGSLAPGGSASVSIQVTVTAPNGTIVNSAFANSGGQPASNTATVQTQIAVPDLFLTKTSSPFAATNSRLTYELTATNQGTAPAADVTINDTLPLGVQFVESSCLSTTCDLGTLGPGMSATVRITVLVTATTGTLINRANVSSSTLEPETNNNNASYTTVIAPTDLTVSTTAPGGLIPVGSNVPFTINVKNLGAAAADNIVVMDQLPGTMEFVSASVPCLQNSVTTVSCDLGTLSAGQDTTLTVTGRVIAFAPGLQINTASVTTPTSESSTTNNTATATVSLTGPDLVITKTADANQVLGNNNITYAITVKNQGGADAHEVVVSDMLPTQLSFVSASPACTAVLPLITCDLQTVTAGAVVSLTIVARAPLNPATITNEASVSTSDREMSAANNTATSTVTVIAADLSISLSAPDRVDRVSQMDYSLSISNIGTTGATNVIITDVLPNGVFFGGVTGGCGFDSGSRTVTCSLGTLPPGSTVPITIHVFVGDTPGLLINNIVTATTSTPDSNPANNSATVSTLVL